LETLFAFAVSVTVCAVDTDDTVAEKLVLVAPAGTVTEDGTVTAELLVAKFTASPPPLAAPFSVTVHVSVPDPVIDELVQESADGVVDEMLLPVAKGVRKATICMIHGPAELRGATAV
jgi:hypothetical protein